MHNLYVCKFLHTNDVFPSNPIHLSIYLERIFAGCSKAAQILYEKAKHAFDTGGVQWPILGICNGFEMLPYFSINKTRPILTPCKSIGQALRLDMTEAGNDSRIIRSLPKLTVQTLTTEDVTMNYHRNCVIPETFVEE